MELFIKYTHDSEPTLEGKIARLEQLLRDIATGSWTFPREMQLHVSRIPAPSTLTTQFLLYSCWAAMTTLFLFSFCE